MTYIEICIWRTWNGNLAELVTIHPQTATGVPRTQSPIQPDRAIQFPQCVSYSSRSQSVCHNFDFHAAVRAARSPAPLCTRAHPYSDKWQFLVLSQYDWNQHLWHQFGHFQHSFKCKGHNGVVVDSGTQMWVLKRFDTSYRPLIQTVTTELCCSSPHIYRTHFWSVLSSFVGKKYQSGKTRISALLLQVQVPFKVRRLGITQSSALHNLQLCWLPRTATYHEFPIPSTICFYWIIKNVHFYEVI